MARCDCHRLVHDLLALFDVHDVVALVSSILRQIREEVGDVWSPREQAGADTHVSGDVNMIMNAGSADAYLARHPVVIWKAFRGFGLIMLPSDVLVRTVFGVGRIPTEAPRVGIECAVVGVLRPGHAALLAFG